jgi:hypothetical protein
MKPVKRNKLDVERFSRYPTRPSASLLEWRLSEIQWDSRPDPIRYEYTIIPLFPNSISFWDLSIESDLHPHPPQASMDCFERTLNPSREFYLWLASSDKKPLSSLLCRNFFAFKKKPFIYSYTVSNSVSATVLPLVGNLNYTFPQPRGRIGSHPHLNNNSESFLFISTPCLSLLLKFD